MLDRSPSLPFVDRFVDRLCNVPACGRRGSSGILLHEDLRAAPASATLYLVVTAERLVVLSGGALDSPLHHVADVPRWAIAGAEVRASLLPPSPGRLRVQVEDGSGVELSEGFQMGRRRAKQVRDALLHDTVSVRGEPGPPTARSAAE